MKNEEKSIVGGGNYGHRTPSRIRISAYQEKKINPAISSLSEVRIYSQTSHLQISIQKSLHQHLKLAFGQGQEEYKETNYGQMGIAALFPSQTNTTTH